MRNKKWLILLLITGILASATSLLAAPIDKRLQVEDKLRYAEDMLSLTGNQKIIKILEGKSSTRFELPPGLTSGDPSLKLYRYVSVNSPEYYFSLAALYTAEGQTGKAIESLSKIAEKKNLEGVPSQKIIIATIHFLIKKGYADVAGTAVTNHIGRLGDIGALLNLANYLKLQTLQVSSDYVMNIVQKKANTTTALVTLADYYFKAGKTDKVRKLLTRALNKCENVSDLIIVAQECVTKETKDVFKKIPAKAAKLYGSPEQMVALAKIFHGQGESAQVTASLQRAVNKSSTMSQLENITRAAIDFQQGQLIDKINEKVILLNRDLEKTVQDKRFKKAYKQCIAFVDFYFSLNRKEDATNLFEAIVKKVKQGRKIDTISFTLIDISKDALQRGLTQQAAKIAFYLTMKVKPREKVYSTYFKMHDDLLQSMHGLPDRDLVSIPLYNGLINEDINLLGNAEKVYMQSIWFSLDKINQSYGDNLPDTLNDFFLLGRLWQKDNRTNVLKTLDRVYVLLENRALELLKEKERNRLLHEPLALLVTLKKQRQQQLAIINEQDSDLEQRKIDFDRRRQEMIAEAKIDLSKQREELTALTTKTILKTVATIALQIIFIGLMIGCFILAWKYSQRMKEHKTYGFLTRFLELNGWLRIFSVLGVISGIGLVVISQLFQIFQKIHELTLQAMPQASYQVHATRPKPTVHIETQVSNETKESNSES